MSVPDLDESEQSEVVQPEGSPAADLGEAPAPVRGGMDSVEPEERSAPILSDPEPEEEPEPTKAEGEDDEVEEAPKSRAAQRIEQEISRRKELEAKLTTQGELLAKMEGRFEALMSRDQPKAEEEAVEIPDFDDDPAGHLLAKQQQLEKQLQETAQMRAQQEQQSQQVNEVTQVQQRFGADEQAYAKEAPDYFDAIGGLRESRISFWQSVGASAEQAAQKVYEENFSIVQQAQAAGMSAPAALYALAKQSGYTPVERVEARDMPGRRASEDVAALKEKVERSGSLGSRGGSPKDGPPSFSDLAAMSDEEFDAATSGKNWRKIAGG